MSKSTILVVDDCHTIRLAVKRILKTAGYQVVVASNGEEALGLMEQNPDLIVLDVNMPQLDGFGFCERINEENPELQNVPIVFLTNEESIALELLGKEMGAYLKKPVAEDDLLEVVQAQLSRGAIA